MKTNNQNTKIEGIDKYLYVNKPVRFIFAPFITNIAQWGYNLILAFPQFLDININDTIKGNIMSVCLPDSIDNLRTSQARPLIFTRWWSTSSLALMATSLLPAGMRCNSQSPHSILIRRGFVRCRSSAWKSHLPSLLKERERNFQITVC